MSARGQLRLLATRPGYRRLWLAEALSTTGDWFSIVAISVLSLSSGDNGVIALALTLAAHLVPQAVLAPVAGLLADRVDRRRVLIVASSIECVLTLLVVLAASQRLIGLLQLLVLLRAATSALRPPASGAALPVLVEKHELGTANALSSATWSVTFALGMGLGGLATELSPLFALGIDALTFFGAVLLLRGLRPLPVPDSATRARATLSGSLHELRAAVVLGLGRDLRAAVLGKAPLALAAGTGWIALNLVAQAEPVLGGGSTTLGVLQSLRGIGTGVGPLIALALLARHERASWIDPAAVFVGLGGILVVGASSGLVLLAGALIWGSGAGANWVLTTTAIQQRAPHAFLGRLLAFDGLLYTLAMSTSALASAVILQAGGGLAHTVAVSTLVALGLWALSRSGQRQG